MARKERKIEPQQELSDLIHGNWEAAHHAIGSLLPPTVYAIGLKVLNIEDSYISVKEAIGISLAGSFALRYAEELVDFLLPEMRRESYIRKNQRNVVKIAAGAITAYTTGAAFAAMADAPLAYSALTALFSVTSFTSGKTTSQKMPNMQYTTVVPASVLLFGSCLHLSMSEFETTATIIKENVVENKIGHIERAPQEPQVEYTAKPPFNTWPAVYDGVRLVNSCFGYRGEHVARGKGSKHHGGIDIQAKWHTPIVSVGNGIVTDVDEKKWGSVTIDHGDGITTQYLHMDKVLVQEEDKITAGTQIGLAGGKGPKGKKYYDTHLHFIVDDNGVSPYLLDASGNRAVLDSGNVNPLCYIDEEIGFTVAKKSGCNTQGGKNKYCGLYKSPLELVVDIEKKYKEIVQRYVGPMQFDPGLMYALIAQESRGELEAGSKTGAYGLMQFIPPTALAYGLCDNKKCNRRDDRTNPERSISAGISYYKALLEKFEDYKEKDIFAIAAYNAGDEVIRRAIEKTEWSDPTWDQVAVMITPDFIGDVYKMENPEKRRKKAVEIKDHVSNVKGYYSFYVDRAQVNEGYEMRDTDATVILKE